MLWRRSTSIIFLACSLIYKHPVTGMTFQNFWFLTETVGVFGEEVSAELKAESATRALNQSHASGHLSCFGQQTRVF